MPRVLQFGEQSVLIEDIEPLSYLTPFRSHLPNATVRAGLESLLVSFPEIGNYVSEVEEILKNLKPETETTGGKPFTIPVEYKGEDLAVAADFAGLSVAELISAHTSITWKVKLIGFAPGFPYLVPVEPDHQQAELLAKVGRLAVPRRQVPPGSVGIAAGMSCIYPAAMPGGWHLLGTSYIQLFDPNNMTHPTLLSIGDLVQFEVKN
jgi:KipI family sensor histidine kinase inhibitor